MTPKHPPTTLELARSFIRCEKEIHYINHGYATISDHLPGVDTEREEQLRTIVKEAHAVAVSELNRIEQEYTRRIKTRNWKHIYNLREIAMDYAWR